MPVAQGSSIGPWPSLENQTGLPCDLSCSTSARGCEEPATAQQGTDTFNPWSASSASAFQVQLQGWKKWPLVSARQDRDTAGKLHEMGGQIFLVLVMEGEKKTTHLSKQMRKTCQKYWSAVVTTALPRFPEAVKQSRGVGSSLGTPYPGIIPAETMMQWMQRQEVFTLMVHTDCIPRSGTHQPTYRSVLLVITTVTGSHTTTPLSCSLCPF